MGMVEQLGAYLSTGGVGTLGESTGASTGADGARIFYRTLVESTGVTIALFDGPGLGPVRSYGRAHPVMEKPRLRVLVRSTAPAAGATIVDSQRAARVARRVYARLDQVVNQTIGGSTYHRVEAVAPPDIRDRDASGRVTFGVDFIVTRAPTSTGG